MKLTGGPEVTSFRCASEGGGAHDLTHEICERCGLYFIRCLIHQSDAVCPDCKAADRNRSRRRWMDLRTYPADLEPAPPINYNSELGPIVFHVKPQAPAGLRYAIDELGYLILIDSQGTVRPLPENTYTVQLE